MSGGLHLLDGLKPLLRKWISYLKSVVEQGSLTSSVFPCFCPLSFVLDSFCLLSCFDALRRPSPDAGPLTLDFPASRTTGNKFLSLVNHGIFGTLLQLQKMD